MKNFFNNKKLMGLLVTVIVFITVLSLSFGRVGQIPMLQSLGNDITGVFSRAFEAPIRAIDQTFRAVSDIQTTYQENQLLKKEVAGIEENKSELAALRAENERLKDELDLQATLTEYQKISATVIARNPDNWLDILVIDRGTTNGVDVGMSVLSDEGLIGRIIEANPTSSKVMLLTNAQERAVQTSAEIIVDDEEVYGLISHYDEERGELVMDRITSQTEIEEGAQVTTSGLGGVVPRGLYIGEATEVTMDEYGLSQRVYLKPATDFDRIRFVTVLNRDAETFITDPDDKDKGADAE